MKKVVKKRGEGKRDLNLPKLVFFILLALVLVLSILDLAKVKGWLIPKQPELHIENGVIQLDSMALEQKIAQMIIVAGLEENFPAWRNMQVGGIHLFALQTEHIYNNTIIDFQYGMALPFFVTADFEGCVSPFSHILNSTPNSEINSVGEAFEKGYKEGRFMRRLGFNLNFAPVVDLQDNIWKCRSFPGDEKRVSELAESYILGLQTQGVYATAKHYPGKTLVVKDPHKFVVSAQIESEDLDPYLYLSKKGDVKAVMVSHLITTGAVDSQGMPSVVSGKVVSELKTGFPGLIISDEIHMQGLKRFFGNMDEMYLAVFKAGNDIILNFDKNPHEVYRMIQLVRSAVEKGEIEEARIDASVKKILEAKGFKVE